MGNSPRWCNDGGRTAAADRWLRWPGMRNGLAGGGKHLGTRMVVRIIGAGASVLAAAVAACASYLAIITTAAASSRRGQSTSALAHAATTFAIFVPAHNEAAVIKRSVAALMAIDYPRELFSVHVVADNCTDETAEIARGAGAVVHVRDDADNRGKGPALNWLFEQVKAEAFDAVAVVDADTVVDSAFLREMAAAMSRGSQVAQGRYDVIEPSASAAAGIRAAALACRHHLRPLGRNALGGSSGLYGNGMVFERSILDGRNWSGHLVEDAEFQNDLLLDGVCVDYVPDARVHAEMPDTFDASVTQNERWELGRLQVAQRYVPPLLRLAATGEPTLRVARLDAAADHLVPPISVFAAANGVAGAAALTATLVRGSGADRRSLLLSLGSAATLIVHVLVALRLAGAPRSTYRALAAAPRAIAWKVRLWIRVLVRPESVAWVRTERNRRHEP